jgi:hypothetical protein
MKRFVFWSIIALIAFMAIRHARREQTWVGHPRRPIVIHKVTLPGGDETDGKARTFYRIEGDGRRIVYVDERGVSVSVKDDKDDSDDDDLPRRRVDVEGIPVPVVPGSRVSVARIEPPAPPEPPRPPKPEKRRRAPKPPAPPRVPAPPQPDDQAKVEPLLVSGRLSATEERAIKDAHDRLATVAAERVHDRVPSSWKIPSNLLDGMVQETRMKKIDHEYGPFYEATLAVDFSPRRRDAIVGAYEHEQVVKRLTVLGGGFGFLLVCLASLSGYIKADEATKGYYTNKLRLAAAAGVGASGVLLYQMLS